MDKPERRWEPLTPDNKTEWYLIDDATGATIAEVFLSSVPTPPRWRWVVWDGPSKPGARIAAQGRAATRLAGQRAVEAAL